MVTALIQSLHSQMVARAPANMLSISLQPHPPSCASRPACTSVATDIAQGRFIGICEGVRPQDTAGSAQGLAEGRETIIIGYLG